MSGGDIGDVADTRAVVFNRTVGGGGDVVTWISSFTETQRLCMVCEGRLCSSIDGDNDWW